MKTIIPKDYIYPLSIKIVAGDTLDPVDLSPRYSLIALKAMLYDYDDNHLYERHSFEIFNIDKDLSYSGASKRQTDIFITRNVFEIIYLLAKEAITYEYTASNTFNINFEVEKIGENEEVSSVIISHKYVVDENCNVNHANTMKLLSEQFLVAKRQAYLMSGTKLIANSGELNDTNFFIYPLK